MRLTIKRLLLSLFVVILTLTGATAIYGTLALKKIDGGLAQLLEKRTPAIISLGLINNAIDDARDAESRIPLRFGRAARAGARRSRRGLQANPRQSRPL